MSIPSVEDVKQFLWTLALGEFEENKKQSSAAVMIRGLIGVIPGIDQILDAQDTIGLIVRFKNKKWQLDQDDYADAAFTAFGWFPEIGSVFKGALKPLWRNSRSSAVGVRNGIKMLESALGKKHGGFIGKIRDTVNNLQKWNTGIIAAIQKSRELVDIYLQMLNKIATGYIILKPIEGWKWTHAKISFPHSLTALAREQIPAAQRFKKELDTLIRKGSEAVRVFLRELLGEHAVVVQAAVQGAASHTRRNRNARSHAAAVAANHADAKRKKNNNPATALKDEKHPQLKNGQNAQNVATNKGSVAAAVQKTGALAANALTGITGEHMADYWMAEQLGLNPSHDSGKPVAGELRKLNYGGRLYQLHVPSANPKGIDSLWKVDGKVGGKPYCIVEAKASATALTKSLGSLLTDGRDKTEKRTAQSQQQMQMSHDWCRAKLSNLRLFDLVGINYSRRVVFFGMDKIKDHLAAYGELIQMLGEGRKEYELKTVMNRHKDHEPSRIFTDAEIDVLISKRTGRSDKGSTQNRQRKAKK